MCPFCNREFPGISCYKKQVPTQHTAIWEPVYLQPTTLLSITFQ